MKASKNLTNADCVNIIARVASKATVSAHPRNPKQRTKEFYLMLEHIKAFFAKLPVRNMSKRKVLATVSALVVIVSVVTITAFAAAATYKVTVNEAGKRPTQFRPAQTQLKNLLRITRTPCHSASMIISTPLLSKSARTAQ